MLAKCAAVSIHSHLVMKGAGGSGHINSPNPQPLCCPSLSWGNSSFNDIGFKCYIGSYSSRCPLLNNNKKKMQKGNRFMTLKESVYKKGHIMI